MGHNSIQPWHYGFCDLSHAQSAVKESKKAAQAAHTMAAWWRRRRRRGSGFFVGRRQSGQARHGQAGEGMAWGTILTGHGVMNGASEIFFLFNWRCQKPFIHCTAKLQMVPWAAAAAFYSRLKFSESSTIYHHHWTQWLYVVDTLQTDKLGTFDYQKSQKYEIQTDSGKRIPIAVVFTSAQCLDIDKGLNHKVLLKVLHVRSIIKY